MAKDYFKKILVLGLITIISCNDVAVNTTKNAKNTQEAPTMIFKEDYHNFGEIKQGDVVTHNFIFKNTGKSPLIIAIARGTCGCTVPKYNKKPILTNQIDSIEVTFNSSNFTGIHKKGVEIYTNTVKGTENLSIESNVMPKQ